jgi:hypothetical protein
MEMEVKNHNATTELEVLLSVAGRRKRPVQFTPGPLTWGRRGVRGGKARDTGSGISAFPHIASLHHEITGDISEVVPRSACHVRFKILAFLSASKQSRVNGDDITASFRGLRWKKRFMLAALRAVSASAGTGRAKKC